MIKAVDVSVAVFVRGITNLKGLMTKGEAHGTPLSAQLADDMNGLAVQAHWACEGAKLGVARLLGLESTPLAAEGTSFAEIHERIDATLAYLAAVDPAALEAGLDRVIEVAHRGGTTTFTGTRFLTEFAVPSFFFHLTTAYAILRHEGVPLQKGDFLGRM